MRIHQGYTYIGGICVDENNIHDEYSEYKIDL